MKNIVILASGSGSNYQFIAESISSLNLPINILAVLTNKSSAGICKKANTNGHKLIVREQGELSRERYEIEIISELINLVSKIDLVVLVGWMRVLTKTFINAFPNIINLHPALPGKFPGATAIEDAFKYWEEGKINSTGVMVHRVVEEVDAGSVIDSIELPILEGDTLESLRERVRFNEKPLLINSIMKTLNLIDLETTKPVSGISSSLMDPQVPHIISGKVRDRWDIGNDLLCFYHSDRLSSFDRHICNIDGKGRILNLMNSWWMNRTRHIIDNHLLYINSSYLISKKCTLIPLEIIVRGFITGNTSTSLWTHYNKHFNTDSRTDDFVYCGLKFPSGLVKNQQLLVPVITPTTKGERDELISYDQILREGAVTKIQLDFMYEKAIELFSYGSQVAESKGLILVDTKYEFGFDTSGNIILIDEIHTCDSSRYWVKETYSLTTEPQKLDKDAARDYVKSVCNPYSVEKIPDIPSDQKVRVFNCYKNLLERLTGVEYTEKVVSDVNPNVDTPIVQNYYKNIHSPTVVILSGSPSDDWHIEKLRKHCRTHGLYYRDHVCSAHKKTKQLLSILDEYNSNSDRKLVFVTVAGMSNALSGVVTCNTKHPVIACPPHSDKVDMMTNINSTLQMPSKVPVATILHAENCILFCKKILQ